jgi:hypothetical protein
MQNLQQSLLLQAADDDRRQTFQPGKILALTTIGSEPVSWPQLAHCNPMVGRAQSRNKGPGQRIGYGRSQLLETQNCSSA